MNLLSGGEGLWGVAYAVALLAFQERVNDGYLYTPADAASAVKVFDNLIKSKE